MTCPWLMRWLIVSVMCLLPSSLIIFNNYLHPPPRLSAGAISHTRGGGVDGKQLEGSSLLILHFRYCLRLWGRRAGEEVVRSTLPPPLHHCHRVFWSVVLKTANNQIVEVRGKHIEDTFQTLGALSLQSPLHFLYLFINLLQIMAGRHADAQIQKVWTSCSRTEFSGNNCLPFSFQAGQKTSESWRSKKEMLTFNSSWLTMTCVLEEICGYGT